MRKRDEIMNVNPEMDCILQHIVDKISYIAEDAEIQKYGKVDMAMKVDAISLYSCDEMHPVTENCLLLQAGTSLRIKQYLSEYGTFLCDERDAD